MDYFILEQVSYFKGLDAQQVSKTKGSELYRTSKTADLQDIDYIEKDFLISDRLKLLFEKYLPYNKWELRVFLDLNKGQAVFWKLEAEEYMATEQSVFDENGILQELRISEMLNTPIFKVILPENTKDRSFSIVVHLSVAESILRRKYLGVNLIRI